MQWISSNRCKFWRNTYMGSWCQYNLGGILHSLSRWYPIPSYTLVNISLLLETWDCKVHSIVMLVFFAHDQFTQYCYDCRKEETNMMSLKTIICYFNYSLSVFIPFVFLCGILGFSSLVMLSTEPLHHMLYIKYKVKYKRWFLW